MISMRNRVKRVAFFGDAFVDVQTGPMTSLPAFGEDRVVDSVSILPGGSVVNTARHFGSLTASIDVSTHLCVSIGDDTLGSIMKQTLESEGVDLENVTVCDGVPMSTCLVLVGQNGQRAFVSTRKTSNDTSSAARCEESGLLDNCHHVHVSGLFSTIGLQTRSFVELLQQKKKEFGWTFSLDTQYDATEKWTGVEDVVLDLIRLSDIFIPNEVECKGIANAYTNSLECSSGAVTNLEAEMKSEEITSTEDALKAIMALAPETLVVVKIGPGGALVGRQGKIKHVPTPMKIESEQCVDTCGAGDSFAAGMLSQYIVGSLNLDPFSLEFTKAVELGCSAGTWCCTQVGACARPVTAKDIEL